MSSIYGTESEVIEKMLAYEKALIKIRKIALSYTDELYLPEIYEIANNVLVNEIYISDNCEYCDGCNTDVEYPTCWSEEYNKEITYGF